MEYILRIYNINPYQLGAKLRSFARKKQYSLIPIAVAALAILFAASPTLASGNRAFNIVGQGSVWGGPNTFIMSTYHFGTGPILVPSGTMVAMTDNTDDPHTLTLAIKADVPNSASAAFSCGSVSTDICTVAGGIALGNYEGTGAQCDIGATGTSAGTSSSDPCPLATPYNLGASTYGDQVAVLPGQTVYFTITGSPGTVVHFMCVIHPWMQGEFIITK